MWDMRQTRPEVVATSIPRMRITHIRQTSIEIPFDGSRPSAVPSVELIDVTYGMMIFCPRISLRLSCWISSSGISG